MLLPERRAGGHAQAASSGLVCRVTFPVQNYLSNVLRLDRFLCGLPPLGAVPRARGLPSTRAVGNRHVAQTKWTATRKVSIGAGSRAAVQESFVEVDT